MNTQYDLIIIGTGAGGGTLARAFAGTGKSVLVLERGDFLRRAKDNWNADTVFAKEAYHTDERWLTGEGQSFRPGQAYLVGGQTKVYGAALFRLRKEDFGEIEHDDGVSPAWPVDYDSFEPWYTEAERLYQVHGRQGDDSTEPPRSSDFPYPPVSHETRISELFDTLKGQGLNPFYLPMGVMLNESDHANSSCIRCDTCDGFPCLLNAKSDADTCGIRPALAHDNIELITRAKVVGLKTDGTGRKVTSVAYEKDAATHEVSGQVVALCAGAINSAALLLRSKGDKHENGLANASGKVGRHLMFHVNTAMLALSMHKNPTTFQKTLGFNDYYFGDLKQEGRRPMGHVQLLGKATPDILKADQPLAPLFALRWMSGHSVDWWMTTEDLGLEDNRVELSGDTLRVSYRPTNVGPHEQLIKKVKGHLKEAGFRMFLSKRIGIAGVAHQCGTARFGTDPATSVLDVNCRAHDLDNLYVVDGSFFPSSGAVNPALTIIANALRVAQHLEARL